MPIRCGSRNTHQLIKQQCTGKEQNLAPPSLRPHKYYTQWQSNNTERFLPDRRLVHQVFPSAVILHMRVICIEHSIIRKNPLFDSAPVSNLLGNKNKTFIKRGVS